MEGIPSAQQSALVDRLDQANELVMQEALARNDQEVSLACLTNRNNIRILRSFRACDEAQKALWERYLNSTVRCVIAVALTNGQRGGRATIDQSGFNPTQQ